MVSVYVEGISVWGPGLSGWEQAATVLSGQMPYVPAPLALPPVELLPPAERRRSGLSIKLALTAGDAAIRMAGEDATQMATVFASSGGDGDTIHNILLTLTTENREVSPTRFHNSVHNAPSGYWALAVQCHAPSTTISAHDASFAAALIEAMTQAQVEQRPVTLIAYDYPYPEPLNRCRPISAGFAVALVLAPQATSRASARLDLSFAEGRAHESVMSDPQLETLRHGNPAARALPLLAALAHGTPATIVIEGAGEAALKLTCTPRNLAAT